MSPVHVWLEYCQCHVSRQSHFLVFSLNFPSSKKVFFFSFLFISFRFFTLVFLFVSFSFVSFLFSLFLFRFIAFHFFILFFRFFSHRFLFGFFFLFFFFSLYKSCILYIFIFSKRRVQITSIIHICEIKVILVFYWKYSRKRMIKARSAVSVYYLVPTSIIVTKSMR